MKGRVLVVALVAVAALVAVRVWRREPAARARPSVLLVTIDTLRADRVGAYGGDASLTPNIDALAGQGVVFEEALASVPLTLPSHATILSGLEPPRHGVHDNGTFVFPPDRETLATILKGRGYATGAFIGAYVLDRRFGLARGFDVYDDAIERRDAGGSVLESERRGDAVVTAAQAWIERQGEPFFAWVHLYDPHAPYDPPPPHRDRLAGAAVRRGSRVRGRLLRPPVERGAPARRAIGCWWRSSPTMAKDSATTTRTTHGFFVYQPTIRIPIVLAGPGLPAGVRLAGRARTADLLPTLLAAAGIPGPTGLDGADVIGGPRSSRELRRDRLPAHARLGAAPFLSHRGPEVHRRAAARAVRPRARSRRAARPRRLAAGRRGAAVRGPRRPAPRGAGGAPRGVRPAGRGAFASPRVRERPDCRRRDDSARRPQGPDRALAPLRGGDLGRRAGGAVKALRAFRALVAAEPSNATFRRSLAAALRRAGQIREASAALGDLEVIAPDDPLAWHESAVAAAAAGRLDDAIRAERRALVLGPELPELHNHLGILLTRAGMAAEALASFERAVAIDPNNARAWSNRGNALRALGRRPEAADAYVTAMRLAPGDPDPRNGLGVLAVESGDLDRAAALFREVLAMNPAFHESRINLAVVYVRQQRLAEARAELRAILAARPDRDTAARAAAFLRDLS